MADDIEARRHRLTAELWEVGHRIGEPTAEGQRLRNARIGEIQAELAALPAKEPEKIGMQAGSVCIHSVLGDRLVRPPEPEPDHSCDEDPMLRFMKEMGQEWR